MNAELPRLARTVEGEETSWRVLFSGGPSLWSGLGPLGPWNKLDVSLTFPSRGSLYFGKADFPILGWLGAVSF